tara:strand:+ start:18639 stop:18821 length:183 start_codon:yes stop_codon:yes gene_type:complete
MLLRVDAIVAPGGVLPISRSTWWEGVRSGRYPKPVRLGIRILAWRLADIEQLMEDGVHGH